MAFGPRSSNLAEKVLTRVRGMFNGSPCMSALTEGISFADALLTLTVFAVLSPYKK